MAHATGVSAISLGLLEWIAAPTVAVSTKPTKGSTVYVYDPVYVCMSMSPPICVYIRPCVRYLLTSLCL